MRYWCVQVSIFHLHLNPRHLIQQLFFLPVQCLLVQLKLLHILCPDLVQCHNVSFVLRPVHRSSLRWDSGQRFLVWDFWPITAHGSNRRHMFSFDDHFLHSEPVFVDLVEQIKLASEVLFFFSWVLLHQLVLWLPLFNLVAQLLCLLCVLCITLYRCQFFKLVVTLLFKSSELFIFVCYHSHQIRCFVLHVSQSLHVFKGRHFDLESIYVSTLLFNLSMQQLQLFFFLLDVRVFAANIPMRPDSWFIFYFFDLFIDNLF